VNLLERRSWNKSLIFSAGTDSNMACSMCSDEEAARSYYVVKPVRP
jgi:hypothetical protein